MPNLAIDDPEVGPKLKAVRILTPDEVQKVELLKTVRKILMQLESLDSEMMARLEAAMDNDEELKKLMESYLPEAERIRMGFWGDGDFRILDEGNLLVQYVVDEYRPDLIGHRIAVVFVDKITPINRRGRLGTQMRLPGKMRFLAEYDAVTTLGYEDWRMLSDQDRQRLVHHELEHLEVDDGLKLRSHDFEDFVSIFKLYGPQSQGGRFSGDSLKAIYGAEGNSQFELMGRRTG